MTRLLFILRAAGALWAVRACAQSGIEVPPIGIVVDSGELRPVQGVAGNFLVGPTTLSGVLSAACSDQLCLAKTDAKIISATGEVDAPSGPAILAFRGRDALVFFSESRTFANWRDNNLEPLDWIVDWIGEDEVLSIRFTGSEAEIAVRHDDQVRIVHPDGAVIDAIPDATGPVLLLTDAVLFVSHDQVILRRPDASEVRFDVSGVESIALMGPRYAAIRAGDTIYALRTEPRQEPGRESLYLLRGNAP